MDRLSEADGQFRLPLLHAIDGEDAGAAGAQARSLAGLKRCKAFLKWAGGKQRVLDAIAKALPQGPIRRFVEPFAGSGVVFLNVQADAYLVADTNQDLIDLYTQVRDDADFVERCKPLFTPATNTEAEFYALRERFNEARDPKERAPLFVYLNRHCFNGLCRYSAKGTFNVPYGHPKTAHFPAAEIAEFHRRTQTVEFAAADFRTLLERRIRPGDVVYLDPPYAPLSKTASFNAYAKGGFNEADQRRLADLARNLAGRGIPCVASNHDTPFTREIYAGAEIRELLVTRSISGSGDSRNKAREILAIFHAGAKAGGAGAR